MFGYVDKLIRLLVLILHKMSEYVKTFKVTHSDKDKNNKLASFHVDYEKLLEKYNTIWTRTEDIKKY